MACNSRKNDYSHNNTKQISAHGGTYTKLQLALRYTSYGDCSSRTSSGLLDYKENGILRHFQNASGIPGVVVVEGQSGHSFRLYLWLWHTRR